MKYLIMLVIFFSISSKTSAQSLKDSFSLEGHIWFENVDTFNKSILRYSTDNTIYKPGETFTYSLKITDKAQSVRICNFFKKSSASDPAGKKSWQLLPDSSFDSTTIKYITVKIPLTLESIPFGPDYKQTYISIDYKNSLKSTFGYYIDSMSPNIALRGKFISGGDLTGLVENSKNIWMHPPRMKFFMINQLNPYPFIQLPIEIGKHWSNYLEIGKHWSDVRWAEWEGNVAITSEYEIKEKTTRETKIGKLECYRVECIGSSRLGTTHLTYYFNTQYGFIYMEYTNIDKSKTILELIEKS
jgi:hypothetical protein